MAYNNTTLNQDSPTLPPLERRRNDSSDEVENRPSLPTRRPLSHKREKGVRFTLSAQERDSSLDHLAFKQEDDCYPSEVWQEDWSSSDDDDDDDDNEENRPALPRRPASHHQQPTTALRYERNKESVMAYMIPLPRPFRDGVPQDQVPQRYMLYMPPSPDLLKIPKDKGKERKRDKAVRLWQQEVKKAKTYNGSLVSFRGMESASIRGAVWALNFVKPSDVTFLSRIPRKSIKSLNLIHPEQPEVVLTESEGYGSDNGDELTRTVSCRTTKESAEEMYDGVKDELSRSKKRTRRDFFIGTALLPVTTAIDLVIPVFGGLSEVNIVWMVLNATGWVTANKITGRLVLADSTNKPQYNNEDDIYSAGGDNHQRDERGEEETVSADGTTEGRPKKKKKSDKQKIEMAFSPCPAMGAMAQYVQAACHKHNPEAFPKPEYSPGEAGVLTSIGWTPERRGREEISEEDDIAVSQVKSISSTRPINLAIPWPL